MAGHKSHNNNNVKREVSAFQTVTVSNVPKEMQNPSIQRGYRLTKQPWGYYIKSIFHIHNETVNVWTHYVGLVLFLYQMWYYFNIYKAHDSPLRWTVLGTGSCCSLTLFNSATAHLLHSKSPYANYIIFMFDYVGVVFWGFGTAFLAFYGVSSKEMYDLVGPSFIPFQFGATYLNFVNICFAKLRFGHDLRDNRRKLLIVGGITIQAMFAAIPWFPRYMTCYWSERCNLGSLNHITVVCISFVLMTFTFLCHQPERAFPGRFDIIGQSHQIFHLFVILTQSLQLRALYVDFLTGANHHCKPDIHTMVLYIVALFSMCLLTIVLLRPRIRSCLEKNKKKI